ncbi:hypothetical protein ABLU08_12470, partial [Acinetobacter nosocomialis]
HKILHILMFITSFGEQNITYKCCSNFLIHLSYPQAYRMAIEYRKWLTRELFDLVFSLETRDLRPSADMVLNLIDGLMFEFLSTNNLDERDKVVERFLKELY